MNNLDPIENDMEQLLHEKGFDELTEAEKAFVLKHIQDAEEYESMRAMLMNIRESLAVEEDFMPDAGLKSSLMAQFEKQNGKVVYLNQSNGFFFPKGRPFYKSPAFQLAVAASIVIAFFMYVPFNNTQAPSQLAHTTETDKTGDLKPDAAQDNGLGTAAENTELSRGLHKDKVVVDGKEMTGEVTKEEAPAELMQNDVPVLADESTVMPPVVVTKKAEKDAFESVNNAVGEVFGNTRERQDTKYRNEKAENLDDQISFNSNTESDTKDANVFSRQQLEEKANKQEYKNLKTETGSAVKDTKSKEKLAAVEMEDGRNISGKKTDLPEKSDKGISLDEKPELMQFFYTSL